MLIIDKDVFRTFHQNNVRLFCHFGMRFIEDAEVVRDVVQEAFISLWQHRTEFKDEQHIKAFLFATIRNRCVNYLRDRQVEQKNREKLLFLQNQENFRNIVIEDELYNYICRKIEMLPLMQQKVLWLHVDGFSNEEIARQLNISVNTVLTHKQRARAILREYVGRSHNIFLLLFISSLR